MTTCYECGEYLHAEQEWRLRPDLTHKKHEDATGEDFIHKKCMDDYCENLEYTGDVREKDVKVACGNCGEKHDDVLEAENCECEKLDLKEKDGDGDV